MVFFKSIPVIIQILLFSIDNFKVSSIQLSASRIGSDKKSSKKRSAPSEESDASVPCNDTSTKEQRPAKLQRVRGKESDISEEAKRTQTAASFTLVPKLASDTERCAVCLDDLNESESGDDSKRVITLKCPDAKASHMFHAGCIKEWIEKKNSLSCPTCRGSFEMPEILKDDADLSSLFIRTPILHALTAEQGLYAAYQRRQALISSVKTEVEELIQLMDRCPLPNTRRNIGGLMNQLPIMEDLRKEIWFLDTEIETGFSAIGSDENEVRSTHSRAKLIQSLQNEAEQLAKRLRRHPVTTALGAADVVRRRKVVSRRLKDIGFLENRLEEPVPGECSRKMSIVLECAYGEIDILMAKIFGVHRDEENTFFDEEDILRLTNNTTAFVNTSTSSQSHASTASPAGSTTVATTVSQESGHAAASDTTALSTGAAAPEIAATETAIRTGENRLIYEGTIDEGTAQNVALERLIDKIERCLTLFEIDRLLTRFDAMETELWESQFDRPVNTQRTQQTNSTVVYLIVT